MIFVSCHRKELYCTMPRVRSALISHPYHLLTPPVSPPPPLSSMLASLCLSYSTHQVAVPLSGLICSVCDFHSSTVASNLLEKNSLELFREIVLRLPVGPHLSMKILNCLFQIVERQYHSSAAAASQQHDSGVQQMEENNALLAIEILCDVMSKKYLPRNDDGGGEDSGALVLVELIAQAIGLLQQMSSPASARNMEDVSTILPLFEFINLFVEYHIERCMASSLRNQKASSVMEVFLNELSTLTRACSHPEYLYKVCVIWKGLLEDEVAKCAVLQNENCLQAGFHIFQAGLLQNNPTLESVCSSSPSFDLLLTISFSSRSPLDSTVY